MIFGKTKKQTLETKYKNLLEEAFQLSHSNRRRSDDKAAEADEIRKQIEALENTQDLTPVSQGVPALESAKYTRFRIAEKMSNYKI